MSTHTHDTSFDSEDESHYLTFTTHIQLPLLASVLPPNEDVPALRQPRYEMDKGKTAALIHPITEEPIHRTIPLLIARLARHDRWVEEIQDDVHDLSFMRVHELEHENEALRTIIAPIVRHIETLFVLHTTAHQEMEDLGYRIVDMELTLR
ncbi:hypothetical protein Tco_1043465 [Tanacetum coccineum]|uniref:Uncharacterized protein n=1 Tax=Tanacetum coccineum TaxID=301880 RepID=A0ABQ5GNB7_9ASTR